uniref:Small ribosomal subunit protein mS23 n=1 Tax=Salix viminalis TaxID=40686 RepID=A0A6N2NDY1_SALVM
MSFMKGNLLTKTRKLVKGLAKSEPAWLKAMEHAPPAVFPQSSGKVEKISLPEDPYIKKFFSKHPDSKHEDAILISSFEPPPARVFGWRVLELKEQGVGEEQAMAVADMEYRTETKAKKKAYARLKQIARLQGKTPPPNPYPSVIKEIQAEEDLYLRERYTNPKIIAIAEKMKAEEAAKEQSEINFITLYCVSLRIENRDQLKECPFSIRVKRATLGRFPCPFSLPKLSHLCRKPFKCLRSPCNGEVAYFVIVSKKMAALELQCHENGEPQAFLAKSKLKIGRQFRWQCASGMMQNPSVCTLMFPRKRIAISATRIPKARGGIFIFKLGTETPLAKIIVLSFFDTERHTADRYSWR